MECVPNLHSNNNLLSSELYTGPALASAGPDWKQFCGTPLSGVSRNFWGGASSHNRRNHERCERARLEKGNGKLGCLGECH